MSRDWAESEHPRWPAKTPGGRGGEFRGGTPGGWLDQTAGGLLQGFMTHAQLAAYRNRTDYTESPHIGGGSSITRIREYSDGQRLIAKEHEYSESAANEVAASYIARAIGAPAPAVVHDPNADSGTLAQYIVGDTAANHIHGWSTWDEFAEKQSELAMNIDGSFEIGLLDLLIHNTDRHSGNWIITPPEGRFGGRRAVAIDHGHADIGNRHADEISSPFIEWFTTDYGTPTDISGAITRAELDAIDARFGELEAAGVISTPERRKLAAHIKDLKRRTDR